MIYYSSYYALYIQAMFNLANILENGAKVKDDVLERLGVSSHSSRAKITWQRSWSCIACE